MKKLFKYIFILFVVSSFTSCGIITTKTMRTGTFMPNDVRLDLSLDDFELLGEMEVSVKYSKYLGIIPRYDEINGEAYAKRNRNSVNLVGMKNFYLGEKIDEAMYMAHVKIPDADFLIPVNMIVEKEKMFLGKKIKKTVKVKAYKIKDN